MKKYAYKIKYQPDLSKMKWSIWSALFLAYRTSPVFTTIQIGASVINGLLPALTVIIHAAFLDAALAIFSDEKKMLQILAPLSGIFLCLLWQHLSGVFAGYGQRIRKQKLGIILQNAFLDKISRIGYHKLEMSETQDLLRKTALNPEELVEETFANLTETGILLLQNLSVLSIVVFHVWWAGILLAVGAVLLIYLSLKAGNENYLSQADVMEKKREYEYINKLILGREAVLERTLFSYVSFLNKRYRNIFEEAYEVEKRALGRGVIRMKAGGIASVFPALFATFILLPGVKSGGLSVGMYISVINAVFSLVRTMTWNLSYQMERLAENRAKARDTGIFWATDEEAVRQTVEKVQSAEQETDCEVSDTSMRDVGFESVEFINVRFCYPGSSIYVLDGISFRIEAGKHYAFVGKNGAGKSTVIKLMIGLYPEYEGKILINGKDLKTCDLSEKSRMFACVWQDYARYSITLRENLQFSRQCSGNVLEEALEGVGLLEMTKQLPDGLDTLLGKLEEGGADLSGGQWQRLAIARAIVNGMKQGKAFILDEPTASLDPMAENQVYRQFSDLSRGRTALFITHRLGAAKDMDEIFVLEGGKVAEKGSHEELMERKGSYAEMYMSQRGWYL